MMAAPLSSYAARFEVRLSHVFRPDESQALLERLLTQVAEACLENGAVIIGHIKLFAATEKDGYFTGNLTSLRDGAQVAAVDVLPHELLQLKLNAHVYGLPASQLEQIVDQAWQSLARESQVTRLPDPHDQAFPKGGAPS